MLMITDSAPAYFLPGHCFTDQDSRAVYEMIQCIEIKWLALLLECIPSPGEITFEISIIKQVPEIFRSFKTAIRKLPDIWFASVKTPDEKIIAIRKIQIPNRTCT